MTASANLAAAPAARPAPRSLAELQAFIEDEATLLDERRFEEWLGLFAEDGIYWVPAKHGQESPVEHVSLFYDDRTTLKTRVARLQHPRIHCQDPPSRTVRLISGCRLAGRADEPLLYRLVTKFVMLEDRPGAEKRLFGGRYEHVLRNLGSRLEIVLKRVDLTDCDQSFPALTQPF